LTLPETCLNVHFQMVPNNTTPAAARPRNAVRPQDAVRPRNARRKELAVLGALFLVALLLNLSLLWLHHNPSEKELLGDENYNFAVARALAAGEPLCPDPAWPPLYVESLAGIFSLFGPGRGLIQAVQIAMWFLAAFFFHRICVRLLPWRGAALAGLGLFLFTPELIAFSHYLWPEIAHLFFFMTLLWLLVCHGRRVGAVVAAGVALGLALLTKLLLLPFAPLLILFVVFKSGGGWANRILRGSVFGLAAFVVVLPTMLSNLDRHERFMIADSSVINLWVGLNDVSPVDYEGDITEREYWRFRRSAKTITGQNELYLEKITRLVADRGLAATVGGQIAKQYFRLFDCRTFFTTQLPGGPRQAYGFESLPLASALRIWSFAMHGLLVAAFGLGACFIGRRSEGWVHCILLFVVYNVALFLFLHTKTRYLVQIVPMMALIAGVSI